MQRFRIVIAIVVAVVTTLSFAFAAPAGAGGIDTVVPVLWQAPSCSHDKLGQVSIQVGTRVNEATQDLMVPTVDYAWAFNKLAAAAQAKGADAVVVRWHQATYFTRNGRRSHRPVHVQLKGAAIRTHDDAGTCSFALADSADFDQRARSGKPVEVNSGDAYGQ